MPESEHSAPPAAVARSRWRGVAPWSFVLLAAAVSIGFDGYFRHHERLLIALNSIELARREAVRYDFDNALFATRNYQSTVQILRRLEKLGEVTVIDSSTARGTRTFHVTRAGTGDQIDLTVTRFGRSANIEFRSAVIPTSTLWVVLCYAWRIVPCTICAVMLLGVAAFLLPRKLRSWAVGLSLIGVIAALLQPDANRWIAVTPWAWVPLFTLALALLAALTPARKIDLSRCQNCKYDLTGNLSGICPECGTHWRIVHLDEMASNLNAMGEEVDEPSSAP